MLASALTLTALPAALSAAESPWREIARMPADNHDLAAAILGDKLYVAGGVTNDYRGTGRIHAFDEIWELTPPVAHSSPPPPSTPPPASSSAPPLSLPLTATFRSPSPSLAAQSSPPSSPSSPAASAWSWRAVAQFARPRIYCGTEAFAGRVWVAGGDILHEDGQRRATTLVETYDPKTGALARAPDLPVALPRPLALAAAGRLWVVGARDRTERGQFASIGPGETAWRTEPDALPKMWALAGTVFAEKLYICVPDTGLSEFDPATRAWRVIDGPTKARSAQVAAWRGEIWIMGGVDIADRTETRVYDPARDAWRLGPPLPHGLAWGAAGVVADHLIVAGGAWLKDPAEPRRYSFTDVTLALAPEVNPSAGDGRSSK